MSRISLLLGLAAVLVAVVGCDDAVPGFPDAGLAYEQCLAASDMELILASRMDAGADAAVMDPLGEAYDCALTPECYPLFLANDVEPANACLNACLETKPSGALTDGCLACYAQEGRDCAATNCLIPCLGDTHALCESCFAEHCQARLDACVGY